MLKLYNSLSRKLEVFKPVHPPEVGIYTCGPTVYSYPHVGNWRTFVLGDLMARTLTYLGYKVHYLMNITDVGHLTGDNLGDADIGEDRMEKAAKKERKTAWEVAEFYTRDFKKGYKKLNLTMPTLSNGEEGFCVATKHIKEQIQLIKAIEKHGVTYKIADGIYFNTGKYEQEGNRYGELSTLDQIKAGARVEPVPGKKDPRDFALWKFSYPGGRSFDSAQDDAASRRHMEWESPWGIGFPGWHIECSAMSLKYLGNAFVGEQFYGERSRTIDIHIGGEDHKSIHHPNEIAQAEAATGKKPFVKYWLHCTFLQVDGGKMGKSKGNVYTLQDIKKKGFKPEHLRYFYLTAHYRQPLNFTWKALGKAKQSYERLIERFREFAGGKSSGELGEKAQGFNNQFRDCLENDLQMPQVLAVIWDMVRSNLPESEKVRLFTDWDQVLGLGLSRRVKNVEPLSVKVEELIKVRDEARARKGWEESDKVREEIEELGYSIKDTKTGTVVKKK